MTEYTLGFIFSSDYSKILLIKRGVHTFHTGKSNGLGGKILIGESPKECMSRESKEESGVEIREDAWAFAGVMTGPLWKVWVFTTTISEKLFSSKKELKEGTVDWSSTKELPNTIVSNLEWLIPFCKDKLNHPEITSFVVWYGGTPVDDGGLEPPTFAV